MPLLLDSARREDGIVGHGGANAGCIEVALINNMPDAALESTERQFVSLLDEAAGPLPVRLTLYALPQVPRTDWGRSWLANRYSDIDALWDRSVDAVIVTGTEPRASALADEPYWPALTRIMDWAEESTRSSIWSCLAAHAAVAHLDGIDRQALREKCSGVLDCAAAADHPLTKNTPVRLRVPHSRYNGLPESALDAAGYTVLTRSPDAGVDAFVKQRKSLFVLCQGHPEYETDTLLREYRRDIGRFLRGERESYPGMPQSYFDAAATDVLTRFRAQALVRRGEAMLADFPTIAVEATLNNGWRSSAVRLYQNWLAYLSAQKARAAKPPSQADQRPERRRVAR
jgi:homoserine O-succinyltransferase/O-acetyltransferase